MEVHIKKAVRAGNSSAVLLPRAWLNKEVRVELVKKSNDKILHETLDIIKNYISLEKVIGVYLSGSYAREEEDESSDIDILVITENIDREMITQGIYSILLVSEKLLKQKLDNDLFPIGTMLKEAMPLLNNNFLKEIKIEVTKKNIKWYLDTTKDSLKIIKNSIDMIEKKKPDGKLNDAVAHSLILRLRTLYMADCLKNNIKYKKNEFIKLTKEISGSLTAYNRYIYTKDNKENKRELSLDEGKKLYSYLKNYLEKIINLVK